MEPGGALKQRGPRRTRSFSSSGVRTEFLSFLTFSPAEIWQEATHCTSLTLVDWFACMDSPAAPRPTARDCTRGRCHRLVEQASPMMHTI